MRKILIIAVALVGFSLLPSVFASSLNIYENPAENSKIISTMKSGDQLILIFYTEKKDWVKVANPKNGDVGWAKVSELKGPMIITKINGAETRQHIIADKKDSLPQVYSIIQYSGPQELKPEEAQKVVKDIEARNKKMDEAMQKMQSQMQENMRRMFQEFDRSFYTFPVIQPIIVVPNNNKDTGKK